MSTDPGQPARPGSPRKLLLCGVCRRMEVCSQAELMQFIWKGWPRCCGEVMSYFVETPKPGIDDTPMDGNPTRPR